MSTPVYYNLHMQSFEVFAPDDNGDHIITALYKASTELGPWEGKVSVVNNGEDLAATKFAELETAATAAIVAAGFVLL